jgi:hypothetical protein
MALLERLAQARWERIASLRRLISSLELEADAAQQYAQELRDRALDARDELCLASRADPGTESA